MREWGLGLMVMEIPLVLLDTIFNAPADCGIAGGWGWWENSSGFHDKMMVEQTPQAANEHRTRLYQSIRGCKQVIHLVRHTWRK